VSFAQQLVLNLSRYWSQASLSRTCVARGIAKIRRARLFDNHRPAPHRMPPARPVAANRHFAQRGHATRVPQIERQNRQFPLQIGCNFSSARSSAFLVSECARRSSRMAFSSITISISLMRGSSDTSPTTLYFGIVHAHDRFRARSSAPSPCAPSKSGHITTMSVQKRFRHCGGKPHRGFPFGAKIFPAHSSSFADLRLMEANSEV